MTKDQLLTMMQENIKDYLPAEIRDSCSVEVVEVMKNNDTVYKGLVFDRGTNVPCPTFYIDEAYENYCEGYSPEEIMQDLAAAVEGSWEIKLPIEDINLDYESIKDKLAFQLVDAYENKERLKTCVHSQMGNDLAMIFYVEMMQEDGFMRAVITNEMADDFGYDIEQLKADAKTNMEKKHPPLLMSPTSMMVKMIEPDYSMNLLEKPDMELDEGLYVLTNDQRIYGSSAIMYDGIQEKLGNMAKGNYYVIPSSTQEVLIVPVKGGPTAREILSVLKEGNENLVSKDEFLSNRLFMYDRGEGLLAEVKVPNREVEMER